MYRKKHGRLDYTKVIGFLVLEKWFPRSIRHCLDKSQKSLRAITGASSDAPSTLAERVLGRLVAEYEYAVIEEILEGVPGTPRTLHEHLDLFQLKLNDVGSAVFGTFFATRPEPTPGRRAGAYDRRRRRCSKPQDFLAWNARSVARKRSMDTICGAWPAGISTTLASGKRDAMESIAW